jgi:alpha-beta hydrolase superfamily lysophospholipase
VVKSKTQYPLLPEILARMAMASGVGYLAAAYTVSRWLTRPSRTRPRLNPANWGWPWESICCRTADGIRLSGWLVEPSRPRGTVALFHGMRFNRETLLDRIIFFAEHGFRCLAFDHRAHGESSGRRTSFGFHESRDVVAVSHLIRQRWPDQAAIGLGISMGAAAICFSANQSAPWDALILESCYHDIANAFASRLRSGYPPWYQRLSRGVIWVTERRLGVRLHQLSPADYVGQLAPSPILVLTGMDDLHASPDDARRLFDRCQGPRELLLIPNARHRDVFEVGGSLYQQKVLEFLNRWLALPQNQAA